MPRVLNLPICVGLMLTALLVSSPTLARDANLDGLDDRIEQMMVDWKVPGMGLVVIKDDKVLLSKGYGVLETGQQRRVDQETFFAIGSSSKAFTAAGLAILVDEGKISWDDPVTDYLPWFQLHDPYATREMRVRDLVAHNSGLSRGDRVWYGTELTREEIVRRARYLPPNESFRATFQYNNTMWIAAGLVIKAVSGMTWDEFTEARILEPLGMEESNTSIKDLEDMNNVATPHMEIGDLARPVDWRDIDNAGPAGSINSNVMEMAQWVRLNLNKGEMNGEQIISAENIAEMQQAQMFMRKEGLWGLIFKDSALLSYGMGWFLSEHQGELMVTHGGNIDGNSAFVSFMPEQNMGLVILTNLNGANAYIAALNYEIYDRLLGLEPKDYSGEYLQIVEQFEAQAEEKAQQLRDSRVAGTTLSLPIEGYTGSYEHEMYPGIDVTIRDGVLVATYAGAFEARLSHWHHDTFQAHWDTPDAAEGPPNLMRFTLGSDGQVDTVFAEIEGVVAFSRKAEEM